MSRRLAAALRPAAAIGCALAAMAIALALLGASPLAVAADLADGAFGNWIAFTDTLARATPLVFCGLAVAVAFHGALWNIGADGQLVVGALAAGALGPALAGAPHTLAIAAIIGAGGLAGALWGGLAGWLRARRNVNEVISTIMLNFIAAQLLSWAVHGPLMEPSGAFPASRKIAAAARLHLYFAPTRLNLAMLFAVALAAVCELGLFRTVPGFELRALGRNRRASAFFGLPIARLTVGAMALSGALAGCGGAVQISAITHRLYETISPGWGYEAIAVALVARLSPLGVVPAALLFGALDNGSQAMQRADGVPAQLVYVVQALVIIVMLAFDAAAGGGWRELLAGGAADQPDAVAEARDA